MPEAVLAKINPFDGAVMSFVQQHCHNPVTDAVFPVITYFGEAGLFWLALSLALMFFKKTRSCGMLAVCAIALGFLLGELSLKNIVCRPRPFQLAASLGSPWSLLVPAPGGYSFPSGHTTASFAAAVTIFLHRKKWGAAALVLAALIGFSRIFLFVHWPTDVLAGFALGTGCALLVHWAAPKIWQKRKDALERLDKDEE